VGGGIETNIIQPITITEDSPTSEYTGISVKLDTYMSHTIDILIWVSNIITSVPY
jgi:hypothetical protein